MSRNENNHRGGAPKAEKYVLLSSVALALIWPAAAAAQEQAAQAQAKPAASDASATEAESGATSDTIVVTASRLVDKAKAEAATVPGTATVISMATVEKGRSSNLQDILAFTPGVFAAATSGTSANKISIRGSGLNTFYQGYSLGLRYMYDGLPFTGPGGTQEDLLNAAGVQFTEVLNGGNAFPYGAVSLGGAINFVTNTGVSSPGVFLGAEFGSWHFRKYQGSIGGALGGGATDYYFGVLHDSREGFQYYSPNKGTEYILNLGHRFSDHLETRFVARYRQETLFNGSTLKLSQIEQNPRQTNAVAGRYKPGTTFLESKTTYTFDDASTLEFGAAFNKYPLWNSVGTATPQYWRSTDVTGSLRYTRTGDSFFGLPLDTTLSYLDTRLVDGDVVGYNVVKGQQVFVVHTKYTASRDTVLALNNNLHLTDDLTLTAGLSYINIGRRVAIVQDTRVNTSTFPTSVRYTDPTWAPRAGLLYRINSNLQVFGNVTRSVDPPVTWQMGSTSVPYIRPLKPQKAWTQEIGLRGHNGWLDGSLTFYRTELNNELLTVTIQQATANQQALTANSNASATIHQGIESGLSAKLYQNTAGDRLTFRQSYNFSDFFYLHDAQFGTNQLPGLPRQAYQGELMFEHRTGLYASVNLLALSSYYVDYANTLKAPSIAIWGARLGYESKKGNYRTFLDFKNIGDKHFAAASNTAYNLNGVDSANFYPGDGFSVYGGISVRY